MPFGCLAGWAGGGGGWDAFEGLPGFPEFPPDEKKRKPGSFCTGGGSAGTFTTSISPELKWKRAGELSCIIESQQFAGLLFWLFWQPAANFVQV